MKGVKGTIECGTYSSYCHGCRCELCTRANRNYQKAGYRGKHRKGRTITLDVSLIAPEHEPERASRLPGRAKFTSGVSVRCACGRRGLANPKLVNGRKIESCVECRDVVA